MGKMNAVSDAGSMTLLPLVVAAVSGVGLRRWGGPWNG